MHKVGVFDSGIGGVSVVNAIKAKLSNVEVVFVSDTQHVPYGNKSDQELLQLTLPLLRTLQDQGCEVIVIACNTVTTTIIHKLRSELRVPLVGMEPMVKVAAARSKSGTFAVCATPRTLSSRRYAELKSTYARNFTVLEPDCSSWASMIESSTVDHAKIQAIVDEAKQGGADVIVLGCTHYHWIEDTIVALAGEDIEVLQPEVPVVVQLKKVIEQLPRA